MKEDPTVQILSYRQVAMTEADYSKVSPEHPVGPIVKVGVVFPSNIFKERESEGGKNSFPFRQRVKIPPLSLLFVVPFNLRTV